MSETTALDQGAIAVLVVHVIEMLKAARWVPWLNDNTDERNRAVSFVAALLTSAGFQYAFSGSWQGGGTLTITWPALATLWQTTTHTALQGAIQQLYYNLGLKKP